MIDAFDNDALTAFRHNLLRETCLGVRLANCTADLADKEPAAQRDALVSMAEVAGTLAHEIQEAVGDRPPLRIAIVGDYSAGKSSFINHLLRDDTLCPVRDDPTTSHVSVFGYGERESITRRSQGGRTTRLTREQYAEQVQASGAPKTRRKSGHFIIRAPIAVLQGIELLDTPGFNNLKNAADTEATEDVLTGIDVVFFLVDANTGTIPDSGAQRLRRIRTLSPHATIRIVFTKADTKAPGRMKLLKDDCQHRHGELFDGEVMAFSTRDTDQRSDIVSREAISALFGEMCSRRQEQKILLLTHQIRLHVLQRQHIQQSLEPQLRARVAWQRARGASALKSRTRIQQRFEKLQSNMKSVYTSEVEDALFASFNVEEIPGTGWIFKDARIVRVAPALPVALTTLKAARQIQAQLWSEIGRHVPETAEAALRSVDATCAEATADTAVRAGKMLASFDHLFARNYDYDTMAWGKLAEAFGEHRENISGALWGDWVLWLEGLYEILDDQHFTPVIEDARCQAEEMGNLLDAYHDLILQAASLTMEFA